MGEERMFLDKKSPPGEDEVAEALGKVSKCYLDLMKIADGFAKDWNYSKTSGWILKVSDKKKALFYAIPLKGNLRVSMAIRESERDEFLAGKKFAKLHEELEFAKKYPEGYAIRFDITAKKEFDRVKSFLARLAEMRK